MASSNLNKYLGSGVLIVDTKQSSLLLVHDYTKDYNCCGGILKYDFDDPQFLEKTAKEELYEETRTLISCDIDHLKSCPFVDLDHKNWIFRCYILKIECPSDICKQFETVELCEEETTHDYRETTALTYFPLAQFKRKSSLSIIDKRSTAKSKDGTLCPLNRRVVSVIKAAIEKNLL